MKAARLVAWSAAFLFGTSLAGADVWDLGTDNDDDVGSDNEIVHGMRQVHDLAMRNGAADADWYPFRLPDSRSYEIVVDGLTGDVGNGSTSPSLELLSASGTTVVQGSEPVTTFGVARSLRVYSNTTGGLGDTTYMLRVANPVCGTSCTESDRYRIRAYDTTVALPRFNNSNGQVTVLLLQNLSPAPVTAFVGAFGNSGNLLGAFPLVLPAYGMSVVSLPGTLGGTLNNQSGSLVIRHNGRYGALHGKGVALEPATGFTFDTAISPLVH